MNLIIYLFLIRLVLCSGHDAHNETATKLHSLSQRNLFDQGLYEDSLDSYLCNRQLALISANIMYALPLMDAGLRLPRGILEGNLVDLGNYHQCLAITQHIEDTVVEGKYCSITVRLDQLLESPEFSPLSGLLENSEELIANITKYEKVKKGAQVLTHVDDSYFSKTLSGDMSLLAAVPLTLALCIPKACTTRQVLDAVASGLEFTENYCRLPGDKPSAPADFVAISIFSAIGLLVIISTCYDLLHIFLFKKDPKEKSVLYSSFSVYTNTRRLLTFKSDADSLDCLDGIRSIAILQIIVGHTYGSAIGFPMQNPASIFEWSRSMKSLWIISALLSVDTFFLMSGLLCSYTVAKKASSRWHFVKNIPLFYLHRYLRVFPLLAAAILLQSSVHRVSDGPIWTNVTRQVDFCRTYWWSALLHVQNYVNHNTMCIPQAWYLSVDMQLYWLSPLVLVWLCTPRQGDGRRTAWCAVTLALLTSIVAVNLFSFLNDFPPHSLARPEESNNYMQVYYLNPLARSPPFVIGLMYGYSLYVWRNKKLQIPKILILTLWIAAATFLTFGIIMHNVTVQEDYDNQLLDNFLNSYMRAIWALAVGWIVFACKQGYGGPINWFLSLNLWKLPARLSFAMYILHTIPMVILNEMQLAPFYFTQWNMISRFFTDLVLTIILSIILTLAVDSPFSTLQKIVFQGRKKILRHNDQKNEPHPTLRKIDQVEDKPN